ncbi:hypothetical protein I4U23_016618 [Adineta vaga]|nr:hypothetical protein I4U23_016618 [Adineta vaga]
MATSTAEARCVTCEKETSTFRCNGCLQSFCFNHLADHRQELSLQLDEIQVHRDLFRQTLTDYSNKPYENDHLIRQINQWEQDSINIIKQVAEETRQLLYKQTRELLADIEKKLNELAEELEISRKENNFIERDLQQWKKQLNRMNEELTKQSNIQIKQSSIPLIARINVDVSMESWVIPNINVNAKWIQNETKITLTMSIKTFENLSDELILMIMEYAGDISIVLRTYFGLNQRFNNIILDRRSYFLTQFMQMIVPDKDLKNIAQSILWQQLFRNLSLMKSTKNYEHLIEYLQIFLKEHLHEKCIELGNEFQSKMANFNHNHNVLKMESLTNLLCQIRDKLLDLTKKNTTLPTYWINRVDLLDDQFLQHNISDAFFIFMTAFYDKQWIPTKSPFVYQHLMNMYKSWMIYRTNYFTNQSYNTYNYRTPLYNGFDKLLWEIRYIKLYQQKYGIQTISYQKLIDLIIYFVQALIFVFDRNSSSELELYDLMREICLQEWNIPHFPWLKVIMNEIMKLIIDEYAKRIPIVKEMNSRVNDHFIAFVKHLSISGQFNELLYFYQYSSHFNERFHQDINRVQILDILRLTQQSRQFLDKLIDQQILDSWLNNAKWLFHLVEKEEIQSLEKVLRTYPSLKNAVDDDGNDLLLYACLKVTGHRYPMIKFLIETLYNQYKKNKYGQTWIQTLHMKHNKKLLQELQTNGVIHHKDLQRSTD